MGFIYIVFVVGERHYFPVVISIKMLKFVVGTVVGWVAARSLPAAPLAPPTLEELTELARQSQTHYDKFIQKIQEDTKK